MRAPRCRSCSALVRCPVINENDTVATTEIRYGDNDRLAARVAQMTSADCLLLLSDVAGLYTADPNLDPAARLIPEVREITPEIEAMGGGSASAVGSGGMATKIAAAKIANSRGLRHGNRRRGADASRAPARRRRRVQLVPARTESRECTQAMDCRFAAAERCGDHRCRRPAGAAFGQEPVAGRCHRGQRPVRARRYRERARSRKATRSRAA